MVATLYMIYSGLTGPSGLTYGIDRLTITFFIHFNLRCVKDIGYFAFLFTFKLGMSSFGRSMCPRMRRAISSLSVEMLQSALLFVQSTSAQGE